MTPEKKPDDSTSVSALQAQLKYKEQLTEIINRIHSAKDLAEILVAIGPKLSDLLGCERTTIYAIDKRNQQIYSMFKEGEDLKEIRVPRSQSSLVGHVVLTGQTLNIRNAYDAQELLCYHPDLRFDSSWDQKSGFRTKQVLTCTIPYEKYLMGILQLLNKRDDSGFTKNDILAAKEVAKTLGIAIYNLRRLAPKRPAHKFSLLIDKGIISEKDFEDAIAHCRINNLSMAEVLIEKYQCPKEEVLGSMATYHNCNFFNFDGSQRIPEEFRQRLKLDFLKRIVVAPLFKRAGVISIAIEDPSDLTKLDAIRLMELSPRQELVVALQKDILDYINASYQVLPAEAR